MKNILIRANSSSSIGLGHIKRDLVLAKEYKDCKITFAVEDLVGNINKEIQAEYNLHLLSSNDISLLCEFVNTNSFDLIIIDSYEIDYLFEKELKEKTFCVLMVLDDIYEKHYCDILLNHNIYGEKEKYKTLLPQNCEVRCGKKYTLIRDEFKTYIKEDNKPKNKKIKVLICMGGVDEKNISSLILKTLKNIDINIVVLTSSSNKNLEYLKTSESKNIELLVDCKEMAKIISEVDFAIVSPSVIVHELLYMKKEFITIQTAFNQSYMHEYLLNNKYLALCEFKEQELLSYVRILLKKISE